MLKTLTASDSALSQRMVEDYLADGAAVGFSAFAQITARCSQQINHAYAVYLWVTNDRVDRIAYTRGSGKFAGNAGSEIVEAAVAGFCTFIDGRTLAEAEDISLDRLLPDLAALCPVKNGSTSDYLHHALRYGGTMPFILLNWAWCNHRVKQIIQETVEVGRDGRVSLGTAGSVEILLRKLMTVSRLGCQGRTLELAIRSLQGCTVDESMLRSAYQRSSLESLRSLAATRGFIDPFVSRQQH